VQQTILSRAYGTGLIIISNLPLVSLSGKLMEIFCSRPNKPAPARFFAVDAWELTGAIATGLALRTENKK